MKKYLNITQIFMIFFVFAVLLPIISCNDNPTISDDLLDGNVIFDPSIYKPEEYLISYSKPNPTEEEKNFPVLIAVHGYSASTFEWNEFKTYIDDYNSNINRSDILISQVLLGGHGRTYQDFKNATWQDWQKSIKDEYERLVNVGYKNINLIGSSTACPLFLNLVKSGYFNDKIRPTTVLMIDPIVIASSKSLSLIRLLGPMIGYVESDLSEIEKKYWYTYRPQETLQELQNLLNQTRKDLEDGITMPDKSILFIYKSKKDKVAEPVGAVMIYNGINGYKDVQILDSEIHVVTRLDGRNNVTQKDRDLQNYVFNDIVRTINGEKFLRK